MRDTNPDYYADVSTLAEIEEAVEQLPLPDQHKLLSHLQSRLAAETSPQVDRKMWLAQLAELRARTQPKGACIQEVMDDIRAERF